MSTYRINFLSDIGKRRSLLIHSLYFIPFVITLSFLSVIIVLLISVGNLNITAITIAAFLLFSVIHELLIRRFKRYYLYKLDKTELNKIKGKKLIHYTNFINEETLREYNSTGIINIDGGTSAKKNYNMKFSDKHRPHVWFHLEENNFEPNISSFLLSHYKESSPRKYKVIIDLDKLDPNKLYVRPYNGNIVYQGNLKVEAKIEKDFKWYADKFYFKEIVVPTLLTYFTVLYVSAHQLLGEYMDKAKARGSRKGNK